VQHCWVSSTHWLYYCLEMRTNKEAILLRRAVGTDSSISEASSLLVDQDYLSEALRTYDPTPVWEPGPQSSLMQTTRTVPTPSLTPSPFATARKPPTTRQKMPLVKTDREKAQKSLMLSPKRPVVSSRLSIVHPGLDPHPNLIHSRDRLRTFLAATLRLQPVPTTTRRRLSACDPDRPHKSPYAKGAALFASKGERVITMSKSSRLLRAFAL